MIVRAACSALLVACGGTPVAPPAPARTDASASLFLPEADFRLVMQPQELAREGQGLSLATAEAEGASVGLGKILVASERVRLATSRDAAGTDVGMAIQGAPTALGPDDVVDEHGERLLVRCEGELPVPCFRDRDAAAPRRLYLLDRRLWFVAAGRRAIAHAEAALRRHDRGPTDPAADGVVWQATYVGASLRRTIPKLRAGPLAPLAEGLARVEMTKQRRQNAIDVIATYDTAAAAEEAEPLAVRVLAAWSRTREDPQQRLASLERRGVTLRVVLRGDVGDALRVPAIDPAPTQHRTQPRSSL